MVMEASAASNACGHGYTVGLTSILDRGVFASLQQYHNHHFAHWSIKYARKILHNLPPASGFYVYKCE